MAKIKKPKQSNPADIWDYPGDQADQSKPRDADNVAQNVNSAAEFFDVRPVDFVYATIAEMIYQDLQLRKVLRWRGRINKQAIIQDITNRIALLDYGKGLLEDEKRNQKR